MSTDTTPYVIPPVDFTDYSTIVASFVALPRHRQARPASTLLDFPFDHLLDIALESLMDEKPPRYLGLGSIGDRRPMAYIDKRAWWEWHWIRNINPGAKRESIPTWLRARVLERDGLVCQLCGSDVELSDVHLDHIHPVSKGGPTTLGNLQVTHSRCNMRKGARHVVGSV